jgi:hypothetical protein
LDPVAFWTQYPAAEAYTIVRDVLRDDLKYNQTGIYNGFHLLRIGYPPAFNLASVEQRLRRELDQIEWLFVTTGERLEVKAESFLSFGIAPILRSQVETAYHATRSCLIDRICGEQGEGLLPSNAERRATTFPDTEGVIHVCAKLAHEGAENDSAEWWMKELRTRNRFNDPHWGIVKIDMTGLPTGARVYQDMHSSSGLIVDRLTVIPGKFITEVCRG